MTGERSHRASPWLSNNNSSYKKSYNIADLLLEDSQKEDTRNILEHSLASSFSRESSFRHEENIPKYPFFIRDNLFGQDEGSQSTSPCHDIVNHSEGSKGNHLREHEVPIITLSPDGANFYGNYNHENTLIMRKQFPKIDPTTEEGSIGTISHSPGIDLSLQRSDTGFLGSIPPTSTSLFQSPNHYISFLLSNPLLVPSYLQHHQRLQQEYYAYNGRAFGMMGSKRKGGQVRFAAAQTARLEKEFRDHKYLHANDRKRLAQALKLTDRQVKTWFQNRRAKWRKVGAHKSQRSESDVSGSSIGLLDEQRHGGCSPDQGRCISVSSNVSEDSN